MSSAANDLISHTLTIIHGYTSVMPVEKEVAVGDSGQPLISNYIWTSQDIRVQGGMMALVADYMSVTIIVEIRTEDPDRAHRDIHDVAYVRTIFTFKRIDGTHFSGTRLLAFKGLHFMRFA